MYLTQRTTPQIKWKKEDEKYEDIVEKFNKRLRKNEEK